MLDLFLNAVPSHLVQRLSHEIFVVCHSTQSKFGVLIRFFHSDCIPSLMNIVDTIVGMIIGSEPHTVVKKVYGVPITAGIPLGALIVAVKRGSKIRKSGGVIF